MADTKRFPGQFMIFRLKKGKNLSRRAGGAPLPWKRHATIDAALVEAARLSDANPECTFLVMQKVARAKASADEAAPLTAVAGMIMAGFAEKEGKGA